MEVDWSYLGLSHQDNACASLLMRNRQRQSREDEMGSRRRGPLRWVWKPGVVLRLVRHLLSMVEIDIGDLGAITGLNEMVVRLGKLVKC